MIGIDCPDERTVQPFPAGRTGRRDANRAWLERRDTGIVAEMEKSHGLGSPPIGKLQRISRRGMIVIPPA
ncbi:hypothetical protein [Rhizobium johnstonii]|uniref:hypothetical protein n=1 Tax=Rhizobium johnstonii TaxID=3019933 RepID=UPI003F953193